MLNQQLSDILQIRYIKLHFTIVLLTDTILPVDKVSALRGGMGEMLLRANCVRDRDCKNCDFESEFYEGDTLQFQLILFGRTIVYFNQYMQAFYALGIEGIGKEHAQYRIKSVTNTQNESLFDNSAVYMKNYNVQTLDAYVKYRMNEMNSLNCQNRLVFHTPATLKYQGKFICWSVSRV